mmetsp:Transcript_92791/g.267919  ORF Transcript_92791/g.267919 Transcript_92791/m.267919 type:complete len:286 (-) Transcript_92791:380-1237(-)
MPQRSSNEVPKVGTRAQSTTGVRIVNEGRHASKSMLDMPDMPHYASRALRLQVLCCILAHSNGPMSVCPLPSQSLGLCCRAVGNCLSRRTPCSAPPPGGSLPSRLLCLDGLALDGRLAPIIPRPRHTDVDELLPHSHRIHLHHADERCLARPSVAAKKVERDAPRKVRILRRIPELRQSQWALLPIRKCDAFVGRDAAAPDGAESQAGEAATPLGQSPSAGVEIHRPHDAIELEGQPGSVLDDTHAIERAALHEMHECRRERLGPPTAERDQIQDQHFVLRADLQ